MSEIDSLLTNNTKGAEHLKVAGRPKLLGMEVYCFGKQNGGSEELKAGE